MFFLLIPVFNIKYQVFKSGTLTMTIMHLCNLIYTEVEEALQSGFGDNTKDDDDDDDDDDNTYLYSANSIFKCALQ